MAEKVQGQVKWFDETKGFGFIESDGKDYFVHFKNILSSGYKTLSEGAQVRFIASKGPKGAQAEEVEVIN